MSKETHHAFPVLLPYDHRKRFEMLGCPRQVPYRMLALHEPQAWRNHNQTIQRLNDRGGLSPCEMVAILNDRAWHHMTDEDAVAQLLTFMHAFERNGQGGA